MSISDGISVVSKVFDCLNGPVAARIFILRSLPSKAAELTREAEALGGMKNDVVPRIRHRVASDQHLEQSNMATIWLDSVEILLNSSRDFTAKFDGRPSNCMGFGCRNNYKLAKEADELLKQVRDLKAQWNDLADDQLVSQVPEMVFVLKTFAASVKSLTEKKKTVENLVADLKARVTLLVSQNGGKMEGSKRAAQWFRTAESSAGRSASIIATASESPPCSNSTAPSTSSCLSYVEACAACKEKYKLGKNVEELLELLEKLKEEERAFTEEQLISPVPEMVIVRRNLEANAETLLRELRTLRSLREDMDVKVKSLVSQRQGTMRSRKARDWFQEMESIIESFSKTSEEYSANVGSGSFGCFKSSSSVSSSSYCSSAPEACDSCIRGFELGKEVIRLLGNGGRLREQGNSFTDDHLVVAAPPASLEKFPIYFEVVGQEEELNEVLRLMDDAGGNNMVGIWGMGGSGKTTLLKRINNHFCSMDECGFDVVLYATAGRDCSVAMMQKEIAKRLGITLSEGSDEKDHAKQILESLGSKKSFLLFLDDFWEVMNLERLGIPPLNSDPHKKQKIVITSRYKGVCTLMRVKEKCLIEMGMLSDEDSWRVFCECVGNEELLLDPRIEQLARDVASECGRLPLALVTVGKAMAAATTEEEWRNARSELQKSAAQEIPGMKDEVLSRLKFSFDRLENENMREIMFFIHAIIGKDYNMSTSTIANWIVAEGLLDGVCHDLDLASARDKAQTLVIRLVNAGLLMWVGRKRSRVSIHDCIHDMLVWLMDTQRDKYPWMVRWPKSLNDCSASKQLQLFFRRWEHAKRIDMDFSQLKEIPGNTEIPSCNSLLTLSWSSGTIVRLPEVLFYRMPLLRILDISDCSDIGKLPPSVGSLANLKYLNLNYTNIRRLPTQIGNLQQLRELYLHSTYNLTDIPCESISRLCRLEILDTVYSKFRWTWDNNGDCNDDSDHGSKNITLQDLQDLTESGVLTQIMLPLVTSNHADTNMLADTPMLLCSITKLHLDNTSNTSEDSLDMREKIAYILTKMERLQELWLVNLVPATDSKDSGISYSLPALEVLHVEHCPVIFNLDWMWQAPRLRELYLFKCRNIESLFIPLEGDNELLENGEGRQFPDLKKLDFSYCPKLSCISISALLFPSLEKLVVKGCPKLRNLHFDEQSVAKVRKIKGSEEWWDNLQWESESVKSRLLDCYFQL